MIYADELGDIRSRGGICNARPRIGKAGRRGVLGESLIAMSSFDCRFSGSLNLGDGDRVGGPPSDNDRAFAGDRDAVLRSGFLPSTTGLSSPDSISHRVFSLNCLLSISADVDVIEGRGNAKFEARLSRLFHGGSHQRIRNSSSVVGWGSQLNGMGDDSGG